MEMFEWFKKTESILSNLGKNELFDYLKFMLYDTNDIKIIEKKEAAMNALFAGMNELSKKNFESAINWIEKSIQYFIETKDEIQEALSEFFLGETYRIKEDFEMAKELYNKAYDTLTKKGNLFALSVEQRLKELEK